MGGGRTRELRAPGWWGGAAGVSWGDGTRRLRAAGGWPAVANQSFVFPVTPGGCLGVTYREDCAALAREKVPVSGMALVVAPGVHRPRHWCAGRFAEERLCRIGPRRGSEGRTTRDCCSPSTCSIRPFTSLRNRSFKTRPTSGCSYPIAPGW